jgi:REP element-mobilizing transposase RayT
MLFLIDIATKENKKRNMNREKQLLFDKLSLKNETAFGGTLLKKSHAKLPRPVSTRNAMHLVLRSGICRGRLSLLDYRNSRLVDRVIKSQSKKHGVKVYSVAKAYNHIHMVILPLRRQSYVRFTKSITGLIARNLLGAERGNATHRQFWDQRPWTRIVSWGREYRGILKYLEQNTLEAFGFIPYQPRKARFSSA